MSKQEWTIVCSWCKATGQSHEGWKCIRTAQSGHTVGCCPKCFADFREPWGIRSDEIVCEVQDKDGCHLFSATYDDMDRDYELHRLHRIAVCVNAWANIADPEAFMSAHDKLVEACEATAGYATGNMDSADHYNACRDIAAALAAVKEAT